MILDLDRFIQHGEPAWAELETLLNGLENGSQPTLTDARRLHTLYERASADLVQLNQNAADPSLRRHLESLVARAYAEIHETRDLVPRRAVKKWFVEQFPQAFRRNLTAFWISCSATLLGVIFGAASLIADPDSRHVTMAFGHDSMRPSDRVRMEEANRNTSGSATAFSSELMVNNTRVSILALSLGMTWGIGTLIMLFYNGVILGAVGCDYILDGQARFLAGWLLPHGSTEIPAILIAGQAGLVLGHALLGRGSRLSLARRLRNVAPDIVTLIGGVALLLVVAGIVEGFFSQIHEPVLPYGLKAAFGIFQLVAVIAFLSFSGRRPNTPSASHQAQPQSKL